MRAGFHAFSESARPRYPARAKHVRALTAARAPLQRVPIDSVVQDRTEKIQAWLKRFDVVIIGPGLGRDDQMTTKTVINVRTPAWGFTVSGEGCAA